MKPIKCWDCTYLGKCLDCNKDGCEKFLKWKITYKEVADLCKVHERTIYRWFNKNPAKAMDFPGCPYKNNDSISCDFTNSGEIENCHRNPPRAVLQ